MKYRKNKYYSDLWMQVSKEERKHDEKHKAENIDY